MNKKNTSFRNKKRRIIKTEDNLVKIGSLDSAFNLFKNIHKKDLRKVSSNNNLKKNNNKEIGTLFDPIVCLDLSSNSNSLSSSQSLSSSFSSSSSS